MHPESKRVPVRPVLRIALRILLVAWAGFWAWFALAVSYGGAEAPPPWWIPAAMLAVLALLVVLAWKRPMAGGIALVLTGIAAASYLDHPATQALLAAPAILLGLGCLALRWRERSILGTAALAFAFVLGSCQATQDPADLPYRTSSILRHANGRMQRAELGQPAEIDGYPCQSWIWWYEDGRLDNFELSSECILQGHALPAGTRVFLDRDGRLAHAWLSRTTEIDGLPCRGRWKIDTAFHPNGRVRAFFPPQDFSIDGVVCEATVFHPVYLHPDGRLQECRLAADARLGGRLFEEGDVLSLDESGSPVR